MGAFEYLDTEIIDAYWSTDINATLAFDDGLELSAYINNLEGNRHYSRPQASPIGFATATFTPPRTYGLRLKAAF